MGRKRNSLIKPMFRSMPLSGSLAACLMMYEPHMLTRKCKGNLHSGWLNGNNITETRAAKSATLVSVMLFLHLGLFYIICAEKHKNLKERGTFMKRIFSFLLVVVMLLSMVPTALATTNYTNGTKVEYVGQGAAAYTITVPALLTPGSNGEVKLSGTWASDCVVNVTADKTVTLTSNINAADQKVLDITFAGISKSGDNTAIVEATETVSVSDIENALFGTWSGKFNYNVEYVEPFEFTWTDAIQGTKTYKAKPGMTWGQWVASNYNVDGTDAWYVMNEGMSARISAYNMICTTAVLSKDAIIPGHAYGSIAK